MSLLLYAKMLDCLWFFIKIAKITQQPMA